MVSIENEIIQPNILTEVPPVFNDAVHQLAIQAGLLRRGALAQAVMTAIPPDSWTSDLATTSQIQGGELQARVAGFRFPGGKLVNLAVKYNDGPKEITDSTTVQAVLGTELAARLARAGIQLISGPPEIKGGTAAVWTGAKTLNRRVRDKEANRTTTTCYQYEDSRGQLDHQIRQVWYPDTDNAPRRVELITTGDDLELELTSGGPPAHGIIKARYDGRNGRLLQIQTKPGADISHELSDRLPREIDLRGVFNNLASGRPGLEEVWPPSSAT